LPDLQDRLQQVLGTAYRLERELGGGGMSRVFVAEETALGRKVVVKVLPPEYGAGLNVDRFRREIQVAAGLHHPHIVPPLAAGQAGEVLYYTMPLIEGESLRARLASRGELPVHDTVRLLRDVVDGLNQLLAVPSIVSVPELKVDPFWKPLAGNPKFEKMLASPPRVQ
jgi:eukaryotic-like serine/threonine-protein kinase